MGASGRSCSLWERLHVVADEPQVSGRFAISVEAEEEGTKPDDDPKTEEDPKPEEDPKLASSEEESHPLSSEGQLAGNPSERSDAPSGGWARRCKFKTCARQLCTALASAFAPT